MKVLRKSNDCSNTMIEIIKKKLRHNEFTWRYGLNFRPTVAYRFSSFGLDEREAEVVDQLNENGFAKTTVFDLFDDPTCFKQLAQATEELEKERADDIELARKEAVSAEPREGKSFKISLLGPKPVFDIESPFARFAMQETFLKIANTYFAMYAKIKYYNVWRNFAVDHPAKSSQLWHHDRDDNYILKVFVYLSDVTEGVGPFTYALGTHRKGKRKVSPENFVEGGVERSTDEQMNKVLPPQFCERATGPKGTIVFADTRGYHKGGLARAEERLLYTFMFTSPAAEIGGLMTTANIRTEHLTKQLRWLLPV